MRWVCGSEEPSLKPVSPALVYQFVDPVQRSNFYKPPYKTRSSWDIKRGGGKNAGREAREAP